MHDSDFVRAFMAQVAAGGGTAPLFELLRQRIAETIGCGLLTASVFDRALGRSRRVYTERPDVYPVGGFKPIETNRWTEAVLDRHEIWATTRIEQIAEVFFDWELIRSLGFESNANLPVVVGGEVIGTLNLLERAGWYTPDRLAAVPALMPFATIAFLLQRAEDQQQR
jgi:GAF domain-containing protein